MVMQQQQQQQPMARGQYAQQILDFPVATWASSSQVELPDPLALLDQQPQELILGNAAQAWMDGSDLVGNLFKTIKSLVGVKEEPVPGSGTMNLYPAPHPYAEQLAKTAGMGGWIWA